MTYHKAWIYFLDDFDITEVGQIEAKVGIFAFRRRAQGPPLTKPRPKCQGW